MHFFQRLSISQRLLTLLGIAALGTIIMVSYMLYTLKGVLVEEEKRKLDAVLSTALTLLSDYHARAETGAMTEAEAIEAAFAQLDAIRYEGNEYVFTLKANGNLVQHPFTKQLVNTDVRDYEDPNGTRLFSDMISRTRNQDWATVEYVWQKGESADNLVPKISRVASFRPWQLIVGTGQYTDNITAMLWTEFLKLSAFAIVLAVPLLLVFLAIIRSITRPLRQTIVAMNDIASGEGDLTRRLDAHGTDEISLLGKAFNHFVSNIQSLVRTVQQSAKDEQAAALTLNDLTGQSSAISSQLTDQSSSVATAVTELSASATEVAAHARTAADSANKADEEAGRSAVIVRQAVNNIQALTDELSTATGQAEILSKGSERIGSILDVIMAIAEQTNLLALNAAIEAARAGEHGRGFAVVADEVRTLATRTQKSTDEIGDIVKNIQQAIIDVSRIIKAVQERSTATTDEALQAETAISQIQEAVANISSMNIQIASATDEQSRVTMDLNHNITDISDLSLNNQDGNKQLGRVSQDLSTNSKQLGDLVQRFKTD